MRSIFVSLAVLGCASNAVDVCAGHGGACIDLTVRSSTVKSIDTLQLSASGAVNGLRSSALGHAASLPVHVAVRLPAGTTGFLHLDVDGLLGGSVVGRGGTDATLTANQHTSATVELSAAGNDLGAADLTSVDLAELSDLLVSSDDLSVPPDLGTFCSPLLGNSCVDANTLERCTADGSMFEQLICTRGCGSTPTPHCKLVTPTGIAPASDFEAAGLMDTLLGATNTLHTDTGEIDGVRAAQANPTSLSVSNGVGFHVVTSGGNSVGVFVFDRLTITAEVKIVGTHSAVLLAKNDVVMAAINVAAVANTPGPGGFAGGTPTLTVGLGPGGGAGGTQGTGDNRGGGGGGGHGDHGGAGAGHIDAAGGVGGLPYDVSSLAVLRGGSGGGADVNGTRNGGAGGGAVQIVSQSSITITGGIAAGGAGGGGNSDHTCGGGGAGGTILLEAPTVSVSDNGWLITGGGGGGAESGGNAAETAPPQVVGGRGGIGPNSTYIGGWGGITSHTFGNDGVFDSLQTNLVSGCGGGAVGRIGINTLSGAATLSSTGVLYIPTPAQSQFTQAVLTIQ